MRRITSRPSRPQPLSLSETLSGWRLTENRAMLLFGGVAGHMTGYGKLGASAGCVVGHHEANKPNPNNSNAQAPPEQKLRIGRRH